MADTLSNLGLIPPPSATADKQADPTATPSTTMTTSGSLETSTAANGSPFPHPYYLQDGLRRVLPYHHTYKTYVKERWRGRTLIDIFECEFRDRPTEYYKQKMEEGEVMVNQKTVGPDYVLKNGELITHRIHRHEPPVTADPVGIIHEDEEMMVINKPSGVPVHPAGRYQYNSVLEIMKAERPELSLAPCNRLDRLTSGIMFLAKTSKAAAKLGEEIVARSVRKEYMARVVGEFPEGEIVCEQPILQISPKLGLNRVRASGKSARTVFKRLAYYPPAESTQFPSTEAEQAADPTSDQGQPWKRKKGYSIVRCLPLTGRTHQIRVHLQFLGHPIQNDPIYANQRVWGADLGSNDCDASKISDEDAISRLDRMGKDEVADAVAYYDEVVDEYHKKKSEKMSGELCEVCDTALYTDPGQHELSLWLHSLRYEAADGSWSYRSPLPKWALPPSGMSGPTEVGGLGDLVDAAEHTHNDAI